MSKLDYLLHHMKVLLLAEHVLKKRRYITEMSYALTGHQISNRKQWTAR